jgi:hypothetical protein
MFPQLPTPDAILLKGCEPSLMPINGFGGGKDPRLSGKKTNAQSIFLLPTRSGYGTKTYWCIFLQASGEACGKMFHNLPIAPCREPPTGLAGPGDCVGIDWSLEKKQPLGTGVERDKNAHKLALTRSQISPSWTERDAAWHIRKIGPGEITRIARRGKHSCRTHIFRRLFTVQVSNNTHRGWLQVKRGWRTS